MISGRVFIGTVGLGLLVSHRHASAQAFAKTSRVGYLGNFGSQKALGPTAKTFVDGPQEMGYVAGQNFLLEFRAPARSDTYEQYPDLAAQLVAAGVDVILASTPSAIEAATRATQTIPIVRADRVIE